MMGLINLSPKTRFLLALSGLLAFFLLLVVPKTNTFAILMYAPDGKVYDYNQSTNTLTVVSDPTKPQTTTPSNPAPVSNPTPVPNTSQPTSAGCKNSTPVIGPVLEKLCDIGSFFTNNGILSLSNWAGEGVARFMLSAIAGNKAAYSDKPGVQAMLTDPNGQGVLLGMGQLADRLFVPPAELHTGTYFADLAPFKKARAAEQINRSGSEVLSPIKVIWQGMRNVAYALYVVVLVVIGFMVMFRSKIDPRTVVSVTAALPNIVISLILITFSFAIAGFLVDIGNVLSELVKNILVNQTQFPANQQTDIGIASLLGNFIINWNIPQISANGALSALAGIVLKLIFSVVALFAVISLFFTLLTRYVGIIIKTIFAPFAFLFGALPGQSGATTGWFKSILVDILSFPLILLIVNIALFVTNAGTSGDYARQIRLPTSVGSGDAGENISALVGIVILLLATKIPAFLEEHMDTKPSGHVDKAGTNFARAASATPFVGKLFGGK